MYILQRVHASTTLEWTSLICIFDYFTAHALLFNQHTLCVIGNELGTGKQSYMYENVNLVEDSGVTTKRNGNGTFRS